MQTCQPCKVTTLDILAKKKIKKPGDSTKNVKILAGYFFDSDKFEEHSLEGFFTLNNIDERQKVIFICLKSKNNKKYFLFFHKTASVFKNWDISLEKGNSFRDFNVRPFLRQKGRSMKSI